MTEMDKVRSDLEQFNEAMEREIYENRSGQKDEVDTASIYSRYGHIFDSEDLVCEVKDRRLTSSGTDRVRMNYLYAYLLSSHIGSKTTDLSDRISTLESKAEIEVDGRKMPFRYSSVALSNEADHGRREAIDRARDGVFAQLNPLLRERLDKSHELARAMGYHDYVGMCTDMSCIDLFALKAQMQNVLHRTDRLYTLHFRNLCKDLLGLSLSEVRKHDISFLFRVKDFDRFFARDRMMGIMNATLTGMGLEIREGSNIRVDAEEREKKSPRAFCAPIRAPDEVVLCIMPKGGIDDYRALYHEMGHAQHFGNVARDQPFEFRGMGDNSVTEAYAMLFEHLTGNKKWLNQNFELADDDLFRLTQFTAFQTLYMVRRYAAKLIYELELHSGAPAPERLYVQILGDALKFRHPENNYLYDCDPEFYSAAYLRAWMFEVQLRNVLASEFGPAWWNERKAGDYLRGLWSWGQKLDCEQMARTIGYYGIDEYPLVRELEKSLRY